MTTFLSLTHNCQLRCNYCYSGDKFSKVMSKESINKALDLAFKNATNSITIGFFGGEPLLEWESLQYATKRTQELAKRRGIKVILTVTTNALDLTKERAKWLHDNLFFVVVSLDGNEAMHNTHRLDSAQKGSYQKVLNGLKNLQLFYSDDEYSTNTVVTPQNIKHLSKSIEHLHGTLGVKKTNIAIDYYQEWSDSLVPLALKEFENIAEYIISSYRDDKEIVIKAIDGKIKTHTEGSCYSCNFAEAKIGIAPSGTIYPCEKLIGNDTGEFAMGNVESGIDYTKQLEYIKNRGNITQECQECAIKDRCFNNCGCTNIALTGTINQTSGTLCFFERTKVECADKIASTLYKERNPMFLARYYLKETI